MPLSCCGRNLTLLIPSQPVSFVSGYRVQSTRSIASLLKLFECLTAHCGVDVQIRDAYYRSQLLEHEEDDSVMNHRAPVPSPDNIAFLWSQSGVFKCCFRIRHKPPAMSRIRHSVEELVQTVRSYAGF